MLMYLIIAAGWLVVAGINLRNGTHWSYVVFNVVMFLVFAVLGVRRAIRAVRDEGEQDGKKK